MTIIPFDKFEVQTNHTKEKWLQLLNECTSRKETHIGTNGKKTLMGEIYEDGFKLRRIPFLTLSSIYYIGRFINVGQNLRIRVNVRYFYPVYAFMTLWLGITMLIAKECFVFNNDGSFTFAGSLIIAMIPLTFFSFGYFLIMIPFLLDIRNTKRLLINILGDKSREI